MGSSELISQNQLAEACKLSGAAWAAWLEPGPGGWKIACVTGLRKKQIATLLARINHEKTIAWLSGALNSGRIRWRETDPVEDGLDCKRILLFPNQSARKLLLVGVFTLDKMVEKIFRLAAITPPPELGEKQAVSPSKRPQFNPEESTQNFSENTSLWPAKTESTIEYTSGMTLDSILVFITNLVPCEAAYLAIRRGESLRVEATWQSENEILGYDIQFDLTPVLVDILTARSGRILSPAELILIDGLPQVTISTALSWMGVPIVLSQRVIGIFAFESSQVRAFTLKNLEDASFHIQRVAYSVENAILFSEATHYLQQMGLLTELASTAASDADIDQGARRVMQRLRRVFNTDWAAVFLSSNDQLSLREYGGKIEQGSPWIVPVEGTLIGHTVRTGLPVRINDLQSSSITKFPKELRPLTPGLRSEMAVPLKYRGQIIGALSLMSSNFNAFSDQDEQLLVLIASHLAGMFENMRLNRETQERAIKLQDTVLQLQAVRQTALDITADLDFNTLLSRIVQRARNLAGARGAELSLVEPTSSMTDKPSVQVVVSDTPWGNSQTNSQPFMPGLAERISSVNKPVMVTEYNQWPGRLASESGVPIHAAAGVPLQLRGEVIGALTVMDDQLGKIFEDEDIRLLELLAPQAAISIRNARLYQELQERIQAQLLAEQRLIQSEKMATAGRLMASIAHEINNPLQAMQNCLHLAGRQELSRETQASYLELAKGEMIRLMNTVQRMLDYYRPGGVDRKPTNIHDLLVKTLSLTQQQLDDQKICIHLNLTENLPHTLAVGDQIQQVFLNLILNASQAMPDGGDLWIDTTLRDSQQNEQTIEIYFKDSGPGIPPEQRAHLFEPFTSTKEGGLGLGLAVSYGIIAAHEGSLELLSGDEHGTCFRIRLFAGQT